MSYTELWGIKEDWYGEEIKSYQNSYMFVPAICDKLLCEYIPKGERKKLTGFDSKAIDSYLFFCFTGLGNWEKLDYMINNSYCFNYRVMWDLCNSGIFSAKDKESVADCIMNFSDEYFSDEEYAVTAKRLKEVAEDIRNLDEKYKYFCIHGTSCDDNVERWFYNSEGKVAPLSDCCDPECCFVTISVDEENPYNREISYKSCSEVTKRINLKDLEKK